MAVNVKPKDKTEQAGEPTVSVFRKAASLGTPMSLALGAPRSGKSSWVRDQIIQHKKNPLWVALNNTSAISEHIESAAWDVAIPNSWPEFDAQIVKAPVNSPVAAWDVLVIDGLDVLAAFCLANIVPAGQPTQADWGKMSTKMRDTLVTLRGRFDLVYAILDVIPDDKGEKKINLNRHARNIIVPLFGNTIFTYVARKRGTDGKLGLELNYTAQTNSALALEFVPGT